MKREQSKPTQTSRALDASCEPLVQLTPVGNEASEQRLLKVLARVLVRRALDHELQQRPCDPALREEAARPEIPRISVKRVSKLEVMTAGELARYLGVPVARLYHHVERGAIPHRRIGKYIVISRRAVLHWLGDGGEL